MRRGRYIARNNDPNKFVVVVNDRREGTYVYRGQGTETEIRNDVNVLVREKRVPPRKLTIIPVKGNRREETRTENGYGTTPLTNKEVGILVAVSSAIAFGVGAFVVWRLKKKKERNCSFIS